MACVNPESSEAFEQRIMDTATSGFLVPCIALGSKLGLFEKMAEFTEAKTSLDIAKVMDYKERYVREWLNSMACLRIFDYNQQDKTYFFPESRHTLFTSKGGKRNIASFPEELPLISVVFEELLTCFRRDGPLGIPYDHYPGFHEWREIRTNERFSQEYIHEIFGQEDGLLEKLNHGIRVCEMECGTGNQARLLAKMFPNSTIHGIDIETDNIERAKEINNEGKLRSCGNMSSGANLHREAIKPLSNISELLDVSFSTRQVTRDEDLPNFSNPNEFSFSNQEASKEDLPNLSNLPNLSFSVQDICNLPTDWSESFDLITAFSVIHDLSFASKGLQHIWRCLKPGGIFYMMDIASAEHPAENRKVACIYFISLFHCMTQSRVREGSEGLRMTWGNAKAKEIITNAGFSEIRELQSNELIHMHMMCDK